MKKRIITRPGFIVIAFSPVGGECLFFRFDKAICSLFLVISNNYW